MTNNKQITMTNMLQEVPIEIVNFMDKK